jgi:cation diffusion facilitator CzcD-associated flavoprotein CzcO
MSAPPHTEAPRGSESIAHYDAVVVGAGPYGLSTAAHLLGRGLRVAVFGKTLELWRHHMPEGMMLRSHWWATHLSDPRGLYGFDRFFGESQYHACYPVPRQAFIDYGDWFQRHAVPNVDETYVHSVERREGRFELKLVDGRTVRSAVVVMAIGLSHYAHRPRAYDRLPPGLVSHSSEHNDLTRFSGKRIVVIGGGQSATEYAALLGEAGATVHVISRRPIHWLGRDRASERTALEKILAPTATIGPGWINWALDHVPYLFHRLSRATKERAMRAYYAATAADWLRDRVIGKATLHDGHRVLSLEARDGRVAVAVSDGETVDADHVILATGYRVDLDRLTMIDSSLRAEIETEMGSPVLSDSFESSVGGLYFVGLTALRAFGPLFRFVAGCKATARRVARSVARKSPRRAPAWAGHGRLGAELQRRDRLAAERYPSSGADTG